MSGNFFTTDSLCGLKHAFFNLQSGDMNACLAMQII